MASKGKLTRQGVLDLDQLLGPRRSAGRVLAAQPSPPRCPHLRTTLVEVDPSYELTLCEDCGAYVR